MIPTLPLHLPTMDKPLLLKPHPIDEELEDSEDSEFKKRNQVPLQVPILEVTLTPADGKHRNTPAE